MTRVVTGRVKGVAIIVKCDLGDARDASSYWMPRSGRSQARRNRRHTDWAGIVTHRNGLTEYLGLARRATRINGLAIGADRKVIGIGSRHRGNGLQLSSGRELIDVSA